MADEAQVNPESEKIDSTKTEDATASEGTVAAELAKENKSVTEETVKETVPLSVFLELKKDLKELKASIKESSSENKKEVAAEGFEDLALKYPDVDKSFIADILNTATKSAESKLESKFMPILNEQKAKTEQENFDRAFDKVFEKAVKENPDLPDSVNKDLIKTLVLTPKYKNVKVSDILTELYPPTVKSKHSSEDDTVTGTAMLER